MEIKYPINKEVIEYEDKYAVTWHKGKYYVEERVSDLSFEPIKEYDTLEEALTFYNDFLEKIEIKT